jgi:hypothetical protein
VIRVQITATPILLWDIGIEEKPWGTKWPGLAKADKIMEELEQTLKEKLVTIQKELEILEK